MKANEFVKKLGVVQSKYHLSFILSDCQPLVLCDCILSTREVGNLKRLIKSHELVESYGGLPQAREVAHKNCFDYPMRLLQAIVDVESCK